jgi:hypothetical protein
MARRNYGPIPIGVWDMPEFIDLDPGPRSIFLSALGICCYRGRFPRDPRSLMRRIGWSRWGREASDEVEGFLRHLESVRLTKWHGGLDDSGEIVWVGEVVGYHGLEGLPDNRRHKLPEKLEWPDPDPTATESLQRDYDATTARLQPGYSPATGPISDRQGVDPGDKRRVPAAHAPPEAGYSPATVRLQPGYALVEESRGKGREDLSPAYKQGDQTRARMEPPEPPEPRPKLGENDPALCSKGQALLDEHARRTSKTQWGVGNHSGGFFAQDGSCDFEWALRRIRNSDEELYQRACAEFWAWADEDKGTTDHERARFPARVLDRWIIAEGGGRSVVQQIMMAVGE